MQNKKQLRLNNLSKLLLELKGDMSEDELAERLGVTQTSLNRWLNKKYFPRFTSLEKIANYMAITVDDLLQRLDEEKEETPKEITAFYLVPLIQNMATQEKMKLLKTLLELLLIDLYKQ